MELKNKASKPIRTIAKINMAGDQKSKRLATALYSGATGLRHAGSTLPVMNDGTHKAMSSNAIVTYWTR
jgi:hypothetical protein